MNDSCKQTADRTSDRRAGARWGSVVGVDAPRMHGISMHGMCTMHTCMLMAALGTAAGMSHLQAQCRAGSASHGHCNTCAAVFCSHPRPLELTQPWPAHSALHTSCSLLLLLHYPAAATPTTPTRTECPIGGNAEAACCCRSQHVSLVASVAMKRNDTMHATTKRTPHQAR
jgi:hypothetical protein